MKTELTAIKPSIRNPGMLGATTLFTITNVSVRRYGLLPAAPMT